MVEGPTKLQIKFYKITIRINTNSPCPIKQNAIKRVSKTFQNLFTYIGPCIIVIVEE